MQVQDFKTVVSTFADPGAEMLVDRDQVLVSIHGEVISARITARSGDIFVIENDLEMPASNWIVNRLARLQLLASRLREGVTVTEHFVPPAALLLPTLDARPNNTAFETDDAVSTMLAALNDRSPLETTVLYVTSDAGEGKTSLINEVARTQALRFIEASADWLLVPIPLGGRHFLRFDDITVGALQNRYRFPFLYYNSFLALIQMGVIVPAFDGFEEMFVESSSGEALSAMSVLVGSLDSRGAIVVAARNAYFDFENLRSQEALFDSIRTFSVGFAKLELKRWNRDQFLRYCLARSVAEPVRMYEKIKDRLGADHSLLTRPVLVRRLVDVAQSTASLDELLEQIHGSGTDYFSVFVRSIIEREANEKWIDRSGEKEVGAPLLTVVEHFSLLSEIALAMWESRVDYLKRDTLEFVADYFCETRKKSAFQTQQVRERIRGHAMLIPSPNAAGALEFDHDEFRLFFLGEGVVGQILLFTERGRSVTLNTLRRGVLPKQAIHAIVRGLTREDAVPRRTMIESLLDVAYMDAQASYTQENCSAIVIRLLSGYNDGDVEVVGLAFGPDALRDRKVSGVSFKDCYFAATSLETTELIDCRFVDCKFAQLRVFENSKLLNVVLDNCHVDSVLMDGRHREFWDPLEVRSCLTKAGVEFVSNGSHFDAPEEDEFEDDARLRDVERLMRSFMRSTHISDAVVLMRLGERGPGFIDDSLSRLLRVGVVVEIENRGGEGKRRFRLGVPVQRLNEAIASARGSFDRFIAMFDGGGQ